MVRCVRVRRRTPGRISEASSHPSGPTGCIIPVAIPMSPSSTAAPKSATANRIHITRNRIAGTVSGSSTSHRSHASRTSSISTRHNNSPFLKIMLIMLLSCHCGAAFRAGFLIARLSCDVWGGMATVGTEAASAGSCSERPAHWASALTSAGATSGATPSADRTSSVTSWHNFFLSFSFIRCEFVSC